MKISAYWLIPVIIVAVAVTIIYLQFIRVPDNTVSVSKRKEYDVVTLALPNSIDAQVFGPKYWKANEFLDANIPCSICRNKAIPLGSFKHDIVNAMNDKPIFNKENWKFWVDKVNELDKKVSA